MNVLASRPWMDITRKGLEIFCRAPPPMCLSAVYLTLLNVTAHDLPVLPPAYLILEVIKDWRWRRSGNEATIMLYEVPTVCMHVPYLLVCYFTDVKGYPFEGEGI